MGADYYIAGGSTSQVVELTMIDDATGQGKTDLAIGDVTCTYMRQGAAAAVAVTLVDGVLGTWSSGGWVATDGTNRPGEYQFGIPDAALVAGGGVVRLRFEAAGCIGRDVAIVTGNLPSDAVTQWADLRGSIATGLLSGVVKWKSAGTTLYWSTKADLDGDFGTRHVLGVTDSACYARVSVEIDLSSPFEIRFDDGTAETASGNQVRARIEPSRANVEYINGVPAASETSGGAEYLRTFQYLHDTNDLDTAILALQGPLGATLDSVNAAVSNVAANAATNVWTNATRTLTSVGVVYVNQPFDTDAQTLTITQGDAYETDSGTQISITVSGATLPNDISTSTVQLVLKKRNTNNAALTYTGVITDAVGAEKAFTWDLTAVQTAAIPAGSYNFQVKVLIAGVASDVQTVVSGRATVIANLT